MLCEMHQKDYSHLVGSATAGIYLALRAQGFVNKRVGIPNNVCVNVPMAVKFSGNNPVYLDSSKKTLGLAVGALKESHASIDGLIAVHGYGAVCDIENISQFCKERGIFLIEDFAPAQGAAVHGKPAGSFGDVSVVSFGAGKIINIFHGGAVLSNDRSLLNEIKKIEKSFSEFNDGKESVIRQLNSYHTQLYNEHYGKDINDFCGAFSQRAMRAKDSFLFAFCATHEKQLYENLIQIQENVKKRSENARKLAKFFQEIFHEDIEVFVPPEGSVYWRFNIFIKKNRDVVLKSLLRKKFKVSSWFPSVDLFFENREVSPVHTPVSDGIGDTILNMWVNNEIDENYLKNIAGEIHTLLDKAGSHGAVLRA